MSAIQHEFLAIDEGRATLLHVDERDPSRDWIVPTGHPAARDMQLIGGNRLLVGHHHGFSEFDIATGEVLSEYTELEGVTAVRRQKDGSTLIAGVDIAGVTGVAVLEMNPVREIVRKTAFPGDYVRLIRQTERGTYLMSCNDRIREGSPDGRYLREYPVEGFYHAWKAVQRPDGNLIVSAGYGAFLVELDDSGNILRKFGGKEDVPEAVNPFFYATFQLMPDGHIILANWQGHGDGFGNSGVQLLEFDTAGKIVWQWSEAERISSLQGVLVLDGLDTSLPHDERGGCMVPL